MQSKGHRNSLERTKLWLIGGLMVASTVLFVIGATIERRGGESHEISAAPQESGEAHEAQEAGEIHTEGGGEAHSEEVNKAHAEGSSEAPSQEADESHAEGAGEAHSEEGSEARSETIFGFDLESPWLIATVALGSLALVAALLWFGHPVLVIVIPVAIVMTLLDVAEVMKQASEGNRAIAILATIIGLIRVAVAILAIVALREWRTSLRQSEVRSPQSAT